MYPPVTIEAGVLGEQPGVQADPGRLAPIPRRERW